jgi:hypothetical protein
MTDFVKINKSRRAPDTLLILRKRRLHVAGSPHRLILRMAPTLILKMTTFLTSTLAGKCRTKQTC